MAERRAHVKRYVTDNGCILLKIALALDNQWPRSITFKACFKIHTDYSSMSLCLMILKAL